MPTTPIPTVADWESYWMGGVVDDVVFDSSLLSDEAWLAVVKDAMQYDDERYLIHDDGSECKGSSTDCPLLSHLPIPEYRDEDGWRERWDEFDSIHTEQTRRKGEVSAEGIAYAGHIVMSDPNERGDSIVVAYRYHPKGYGAIVGLAHEDTPTGRRAGLEAHFGWIVSCYAN